MNQANPKLKITLGLVLPLLLTMLLACPVGPIYGKDKDENPKAKHSSASKKKKGKQNKGLTVKVEKDPQTGPMEDVSNLTEVSQAPGQDEGAGKSKKSKK